MQQVFQYIRYGFWAITFFAFVYSCANMASPSGGEYDVAPPKIRRANPDFNALNSSKTVVEIEFDENIKIESPSEKVIITPPQQNMPVIKSVGRKAVVELNDELLPNTTYTIDFTDAIVDNNEANPLENFVYSFSTGDRLDTLAVSGKVLTADNLEPVSGTYVGIHSNLNDTAFTHVPFERISRTDSRGNFTVRGMAPGSYKIYALNDLNRDYKYDNPQEAVAFLDSIIIPSTMPATRQDTIFKDSVTIDTIKTVAYTRFLPDKLLLRSFLSDFQRQYLQKHERPEENKMVLYFAAPTAPPSFELLQPVVEDDHWYVAEKSAKNDTLTLWITDSLLYKRDSLLMRVDYTRTDSLNKNFIDTDTLKFNIRRARPKSEKRKKKEDEEEPIRFLNIQHNIQSTFEIYNPIRFEFEQPVIQFDSSRVHLSQEVDSVFSPISFQLNSDSLNPRKYILRHKWAPGGKYKLTVDSASVFSHYGLWNNTLDETFSIKTLEQYGNLFFLISGLPEGKTAYVELLDKSDKPFRKVRVKNNEAHFWDLNPGQVYARLFIDDNEDGIWTTGSFEKKRHPEPVYYNPKMYEIRAYTDHEESWNLLEKEVAEQKPLEITKNKPKEKKRNQNVERQQQQQQQQQQRGASSGTNSSTSSMRQQSLNR